MGVFLWYNNPVKTHESRVFVVRISSPYITLGQFLKMTDWIESGGQAKFAVKELKISVNGEPEDRRGRKLVPNDSVLVEGKAYTISQ